MKDKKKYNPVTSLLQQQQQGGMHSPVHMSHATIQPQQQDIPQHGMQVSQDVGGQDMSLQANSDRSHQANNNGITSTTCGIQPSVTQQKTDVAQTLYSQVQASTSQLGGYNEMEATISTPATSAPLSTPSQSVGYSTSGPARPPAQPAPVGFKICWSLVNNTY